MSEPQDPQDNFVKQMLDNPEFIALIKGMFELTNAVDKAADTFLERVYHIESEEEETE